MWGGAGPRLCVLRLRRSAGRGCGRIPVRQDDELPLHPAFVVSRDEAAELEIADTLWNERVRRRVVIRSDGDAPAGVGHLVAAGPFRPRGREPVGGVALT